MKCSVCGLRIRRVRGVLQVKYTHDDSAYDPFKSPVHAPTPAASPSHHPERDDTKSTGSEARTRRGQTQ